VQATSKKKIDKPAGEKPVKPKKPKKH